MNNTTVAIIGVAALAVAAVTAVYFSRKAATPTGAAAPAATAATPPAPSVTPSASAGAPIALTGFLKGAVPGGVPAGTVPVAATGGGGGDVLSKVKGAAETLGTVVQTAKSVFDTVGTLFKNKPF